MLPLRHFQDRLVLRFDSVKVTSLGLSRESTNRFRMITPPTHTHTHTHTHTPRGRICKQALRNQLYVGYSGLTQICALTKIVLCQSCTTSQGGDRAQDCLEDSVVIVHKTASQGGDCAQDCLIGW